MTARAWLPVELVTIPRHNAFSSKENTCIAVMKHTLLQNIFITRNIVSRSTVLAVLEMSHLICCASGFKRACDLQGHDAHGK